MLDHRTISLADQVFERLEDEILSGRYQRGELLTEQKLVTDLEVSRTPIREAIRRLEMERLIKTTSKGILIVGVTVQDMKDIFDIRMRLEGFAAASAARNVAPEQLDELKESLELQEFYLPKNNAGQIKIYDDRFHQIIYKSSGSNALYDALVPLHNKVSTYRKNSLENPARAYLSLAEHRGIYEAIANHDEALAEQRMSEHIKNARDAIIGKEDL